MRLDLFLKITRLVARRALAQSLCDADLVYVNGATAKSSKDIKVGDEIELRKSSGTLTVRVKQLPVSKQVAKSSTSELFELVSPTSPGKET